MDLKMEVYTPGLELLGLLEVQNSVIWGRKAFGAGSFSVSSILTKETRPLLAAENILWIAGDDAGVIEYINQEAEERTNITVKGCNLTGLLARRILWGRYDLSGTPPQIMHYLVNECAVNPTRGDIAARKIPGLVLLDPPAGGTSIRIQRTGGGLLEVLEELGAAYGVAFGIGFNPAVPQMEFWTRWGVNRSIRQNVNDHVFYSTELDDVLSSKYTYNSGDYRNVALIAGEGEGNNRVMVTVEGEDETYIPDVPAPEPTPDKYTVTLSVDPSGGGAVTGAGQYQEGATATITATPADGYTFNGWTENGEMVSTSESYTFAVTGNRAFVAGFSEFVSRLPEGYTELKYIESTGTQYVNTGLKPTTTTKVEMDFEFSDYSGSPHTFGSNSSRKSGSNTYYYYYRAYESNGGFYGSVCGDSLTIASGLIAENIQGRISLVFDAENKSASINGASKAIEVSGSMTSTYTKNIYLLCINWNGTASNYSKAKLYSAKIYNGNTLARDYVPCANPSGEAGLYDLVSGSFYGNAGSGAFVAGPAI